MVAQTSIEWTDMTLNPGIYGCSPVSPGCANCYAAKMAHRQTAMGNYPEGITKKTANGVKWTGKIIVDQSAVTREFAKLPKKVHKKVFVTSMADLFHENVPDDFICDVFYMMAQMKHHTFMVLTKRARRMYEWFNRPEAQGSKWHKPLPNVIGMVTAEDQEQADKRIPWLLQCPFAVRGVSIEPMLGPIDLHFMSQSGYRMLSRWYGPDGFDKTGSQPELKQLKPNWIILGGETGPGARQMHPDWARSVCAQCQNAGIDFLFKAWGDCEPQDKSAWAKAGWSETGKHHGRVLL